MSKGNIYLYGTDTINLRIIRSLLDKGTESYMYVAYSNNEIPPIVVTNRYPPHTQENDRHIIILESKSSLPEYIDDLRESFAYIIRPDYRVGLFIFNPDIATELNLPENYRNLSVSTINWFKDNKDKLKENPIISSMIEFIQPR